MDVEKTIQFILEQQAQFWATLQKRRERSASVRACLQADQKRLGQNLLKLARMQSQHRKMIGGLRATVRQIAPGTDPGFRKLPEAQRRTDQRLKALIKFVNDRNRRKDRHS